MTRDAEPKPAEGSRIWPGVPDPWHEPLPLAINVCDKPPECGSQRRPSLGWCHRGVGAGFAVRVPQPCQKRGMLLPAHQGALLVSLQSF